MDSNYDLYISADSNEVKAIVENKIPFDLVKNYNFSTNRICLNGKINTITNIPALIGEDIKEHYQLNFNPMSIISGGINKKIEEILVTELVNEGLSVGIRENNG